MVTKLIPNDVDIYEQFRRRDQFIKMAAEWAGAPVTGGYSPKIDLDQLEKDSGVRCIYVGDNLAGFELVDERAWAIFILKWL
jgi:hypothetical protein